MFRKTKYDHQSKLPTLMALVCPNPEHLQAFSMIISRIGFPLLICTIEYVCHASTFPVLKNSDSKIKQQGENGLDG
jgi:hypothetical protein